MRRCAIGEKRVRIERVGKQCYQQFMFLVRKRICDRNALPYESFLQVLRKKQTASAFRSSGEDHCGLNAERMVGREVSCCENRLGGRLDQRFSIAPVFFFR